MSQIAAHKGIITSILGDTVQVKIESLSACASCHAKSMCTLSEKEDKLIDVKIPKNRELHIGDLVTVCVSKEKGMQAVFLAYVIPTLIVIAAIIVFLQLSFSEVLAIVASLIILALYYGVLYCFRHKINDRFTFYLKEE